MRRKATALLAAALGFLLGGCGTMVNCLSVNGPAAKEIYGGVKQDAQSGSDHLVEAFSRQCPSFSGYPGNPSLGGQVLMKSFCAGCGLCMLAVDLPVSAVTDTLTLPLTIPATAKKRKDQLKRKQHAEKARKQAARTPAVHP